MLKPNDMKTDLKNFTIKKINVQLNHPEIIRLLFYSNLS